MALEIVRRFVNGAWKTEAAETGGGGSQPVTGFETANIESVAATTNDYMAFSHASGDTLLDYADPNFPAVVADGVYCFMFRLVTTSGSFPGEFWGCQFVASDGVTIVRAEPQQELVDPGGDPMNPTNDLPVISASLTAQQTVVGAGGPLVRLFHTHPGTLDVVGHLYIQRIS